MCPLSVSHALRAFLRLEPAGLVSCRSRPWGFTLQGSFHSRSRAPFRMPVPSCGSPASGFAAPHRQTASAFQGRPFGTDGYLKGAAPVEADSTSGPCSPRVSVLVPRLFRPEHATRPSWASPSLGVSPFSAGLSWSHPLLSFCGGAHWRRRLLFRVFTRRKGRLLALSSPPPLPKFSTLGRPLNEWAALSVGTLF